MKKLLLHSCCAPCSSSVLEQLVSQFAVTVYYYNPNIYPPNEYFKRLAEQKKLLHYASFGQTVKLLEGTYNPNVFTTAVESLKTEPEGGTRCAKCFKLRLKETAKMCENLSIDCFATTLSVSPHKNANAINEIGLKVSKQTNISYLACNFSEKNGFKRSAELAQKYNLYRQNYCGCIYSKK
ncbi:MAG: epoxyqueuosine reductase QueH [Oscillospiraceae bacterium]|jgi:predicted adenine nucleotide alpha hydrolase (AANH) superfamily ATPase|nr:epoxyqueuosine reductase QueH [Oscillospiraceae bacterium]